MNPVRSRSLACEPRPPSTENRVAPPPSAGNNKHGPQPPSAASNRTPLRFATAGLLAALFTVGCTAPAIPTEPTLRVATAADYETLFEATLSVLRVNDFTPLRADRQTGEIVTQPATSAQWFEFWRGDSQTGYDKLESSLHTTRRYVTVHIDPPEGQPRDPGGPQDLTLTVEVQKERFNASERQVTTASGALGIYNERLPTSDGLRNARTPGESWIPKGRDAELEHWLLDKCMQMFEERRHEPRSTDTPPAPDGPASPEPSAGPADPSVTPQP